jgi:hypothetical protein
MPAAGMFGKLAPHPEDTHPRVKLATHTSIPGLPPTPAVVDYASKVRSWPMYMNNQLGDCTCAGIAHMVQAWTAYSRGLVTVPNSAVLDLYERMGYVPGRVDTDRGAVEQDVLAEVHRNGIGGHKILAYAQVDHTNLDAMKTALFMFGSLYLGAQMPGIAATQFEQHQPWHVQPGSPIEGGHCFVAQRWDVSDAPMEVVTWGALQRVTEEWWMTYGEEAWVIITPDWMTANGKSANGIDVVSLGDEFGLLTGTLNPFRAAPKSSKHFCLGLRDKIRRAW